jgi:hypothetical protein
VLWFTAAALHAMLTTSSTWPSALASLVFPSSISGWRWAGPQPWALLVPLLSAVAIGSVVLLGRQHRTRSDRTGPVSFGLAWLRIILAGAAVGAVLGIAGVLVDWPPPRVWFAFDGIADAASAGALWAVVWGWAPALWIALATAPRASAEHGIMHRTKGEWAALAGAVLAFVALLIVAGQPATRPSYAHEAAGTPTPTPTAAVHTVPAVAPNAPAPDPQWCTEDQAQVGLLGTDGALGHRVLTVQVTNRSGVDCQVNGYPDIAFGGAGDALLRVHLVHGDSAVTADPGPTAVVLSAGQSAVAQLGWDTQANDPDSRVRFLHLAPYQGFERAQLPVDVDIVAGASVAVTAWQAQGSR